VVHQGQFLERPAIIAVGNCVLDGLWHRGEVRPPLLIIPPPPNQGSMHHPVLSELAWAAATSGFPTLRFDFRGVGASQGQPSGPAERLTDAEAALRLLEENTGVARAAVASFGRPPKHCWRCTGSTRASRAFASSVRRGCQPPSLLRGLLPSSPSLENGMVLSPQLHWRQPSPRPPDSWRSSPPPTTTSTATYQRWARRWCGGCSNCGPPKAEQSFRACGVRELNYKGIRS